MKSCKFRLLILFTLTSIAIVFPGMCGEPKTPDPDHPFGASGMWFFKGMGWKLGDRSHYAMKLMFDPPLTHEGAEPIGISIRNINPILGNHNTKTDAPADRKFCTFEGLIWTLTDQFGYSARAILGPDQSLIGFSFRVWNNSKKHPLVLMRRPDTPLFITTVAIDNIDSSQRAKAASTVRQGDAKPVEWTLKPREKEEAFVSLREFLPEGSEAKDQIQCHFGIQVNVSPKNDLKPDRVYYESPFPDISGIAALITKQGLALNPAEALKEAEKHTPALFQGK